MIDILCSAFRTNPVIPNICSDCVLFINNITVQIRGCLAEHVRWGDAFAVVYSVCERRSFLAAAELLSLLERTRLPGCAAVTLLGNKRDLEHARYEFI